MSTPVCQIDDPNINPREFLTNRMNPSNDRKPTARDVLTGSDDEGSASDMNRARTSPFPAFASSSLTLASTARSTATVPSSSPDPWLPTRSATPIAFLTPPNELEPAAGSTREDRMGGVDANSAGRCRSRAEANSYESEKG